MNRQKELLAQKDRQLYDIQKELDELKRRGPQKIIEKIYEKTQDTTELNRLRNELLRKDSLLKLRDEEIQRLREENKKQYEEFHTLMIKSSDFKQVNQQIVILDKKVFELTNENRRLKDLIQ